MAKPEWTQTKPIKSWILSNFGIIAIQKKKKKRADIYTCQYVHLQTNGAITAHQKYLPVLHIWKGKTVRTLVIATK